MSSKKKNLWLSTILPIALLFGVVVLVKVLTSSKPQAFSRKVPERVETVEVQPIEFTDYQVLLDSYGNIQASTSSELVAQVSGQVVSVADNFETGLPIKKGQELLQIDARDYMLGIIRLKCA